MRSHLYAMFLVTVAIMLTVVVGRAVSADHDAPQLVGMAVFWASIIVGMCSGLLAAVRRRVTRNCVPRLFLWLVTVSCLFYFIVVANIDRREAFWLCACNNQLKQIGLALHSYAQKYACLPPAYVTDKGGKPMHSWRVLILPFMEQNSLYDQYDFNEPWDGPKNKPLLAKQPREYVCPDDTGAYYNHTTDRTSYVAIVGAKAAWHGDTPVKFSDLPRDLDRTVLVIEIANSGIGWTEPRDLSWDEVRKRINMSPGMAISPKHRIPRDFFTDDSPGIVWALRADGSVTQLPAWSLTTPKLIETALTAGKYDEVCFRGVPITCNVNWWNCLALVIWTGSIYLLLRRMCRPTCDGICTS